MSRIKEIMKRYILTLAVVFLFILPVSALETHGLYYLTSNTRVYYTLSFGDQIRTVKGYAKVYGRDRINTATTWSYIKWTKFTGQLGAYTDLIAKAEDLGPTDNTKYTQSVVDTHPSDISLSCYYDYKKYTYPNSIVPDNIEDPQ